MTSSSLHFTHRSALLFCESHVTGNQFPGAACSPKMRACVRVCVCVFIRGGIRPPNTRGKCRRAPATRERSDARRRRPYDTVCDSRGKSCVVWGGERDAASDRDRLSRDNGEVRREPREKKTYARFFPVFACAFPIEILIAMMTASFFFFFSTAAVNFDIFPNRTIHARPKFDSIENINERNECCRVFFFFNVVAGLTAYENTWFKKKILFVCNELNRKISICRLSAFLKF